MQDPWQERSEMQARAKSSALLLSPEKLRSSRAEHGRNEFGNVFCGFLTGRFGFRGTLSVTADRFIVSSLSRRFERQPCKSWKKSRGAGTPRRGLLLLFAGQDATPRPPVRRNYSILVGRHVEGIGLQIFFCHI